jgi:sugar phosphate isomerase/epimerase
MAFVSGPFIKENKKAAITALAESVCELEDYAKKVGINLLLEIFDYDIHRNQLIGSTRDALRLLDCLPSACSAFSLQVDLSHIPLLRESSIHDAVRPLKGKIGHVHIGSCVMDPDDERYGDLHPYFGYARGKNDGRK